MFVAHIDHQTCDDLRLLFLPMGQVGTEHMTTPWHQPLLTTDQGKRCLPHGRLELQLLGHEKIGGGTPLSSLKRLVLGFWRGHEPRRHTQRSL